MENRKAVWRFPAYSADANKVGKELSSLGPHTPQMVVEYAKNPETELHKCFDWDVEVAANKWWIQQARHIESALVYEPRTQNDTPIRIFSRDKEENVYKKTTEFFKNEQKHQLLLNTAMEELIKFKNKYQSLAELVELEDVFKEIDKLANKKGGQKQYE